MRRITATLFVMLIFFPLATPEPSKQSLPQNIQELLQDIDLFCEKHDILTTTVILTAEELQQPEFLLVVDVFRKHINAIINQGLGNTAGIFSLPQHGSSFRSGIVDGVAHMAARAFVAQSNNHGTTSTIKQKLDTLLRFRKERARVVVTLDARIRLLLQNNASSLAETRDNLTKITVELQLLQTQIANEQNPVRAAEYGRQRDQLQEAQNKMQSISAETEKLFQEANKQYTAVIEEIDADIITDNFQLVIGETVFVQLLETDRHFGLGRMLVEYSQSLPEAVVLLQAASHASAPEQFIWDALRYDEPRVPTLLERQPTDQLLSIERRGDNISSVLQRYGYSQKNVVAVLKANPSINAKAMHIGDTFIVPAVISNTASSISTADWLALTKKAAQQIAKGLNRPIKTDHIRWDLFLTQEIFPATPPGFVTALTVTETGGGSNHGTGRFHSDMAKSLWPLFFDWCSQWGMDPFLVPVSRGAGAVGETQFMIHTWNSFADHTRENTGQQTPWPWNIRTAFAATNSYLNARGGFQRKEFSETLLFYYMGSRWEEKLKRSYGDRWRDHIESHSYPRTILRNAHYIHSVLEKLNLVQK